MSLVTVYTYQQMSALVDPSNPNFSSYFPELGYDYIEVFALVTNGNRTWREKFKATTDSSTEFIIKQIRETLEFFNSTIHPSNIPYEKFRTFIELYVEDEEVSQYEDDFGMSGWLDPEGVFHPCGFGEHSSYAINLMMEEAMESGEFSGASQAYSKYASNQHIPMSNVDMSTSTMAILGDLTEKQVDWFNRYFFKLNSKQKSIVSNKAKEQGIKLKYDW